MLGQQSRPFSLVHGHNATRRMTHRLGNGFSEKTKDNTATLSIFDINIKEDLVGDLFKIAVEKESKDRGEVWMVRRALSGREQDGRICLPL